LPPQADRPSVAGVATVAGVADAKHGSRPLSGRGTATCCPARIADLEDTPKGIILAGFERFLLQHRPREVGPGLKVVRAFLADHHHAARLLGWTATDLFGCHPDPRFAAARYDLMGAVTLAALASVRVALVTADTVRLDDGLAHRRGASPIVEPALVWKVFADPD